MSASSGRNIVRLNDAIAIADLWQDDCRSLSLYFSNLTVGSRYNRFLGAIADASPMIDRLFALGRQANRWVTARCHGHIVGEAIVAFDVSVPTAEFAISVTDNLHQSGIGSLLLATIENIAIEQGSTHLLGDVLASNDIMLSFAKKSGFIQHQHFCDRTLALIEKPLI